MLVDGIPAKDYFYPWECHTGADCHFREMTKIDDDFFISSAKYDMDLLKKNKIQTIVNCAKEVDKPDGFVKDIDYKKFSIDDCVFSNEFTEHFEEFFSFVDKCKKPCLVHCILGMSRSPSFLIGYLMRKNKWTLKKAFDYVQSKRSVITIDNFEYELKEMEKKMCIDTN